jgi:hypothetical protein
MFAMVDPIKIGVGRTVIVGRIRAHSGCDVCSNSRISEHCSPALKLSYDFSDREGSLAATSDGVDCQKYLITGRFSHGYASYLVNHGCYLAGVT